MSDDELVVEFRNEALERLVQVEDALLGIEQGDSEAVNKGFRALHTIKGNASFVDFVPVNRLAHELEFLLDDVRKGVCSSSPAIIDVLLRGVDRLRRLVGAPGDGGGIAIDDLVAAVRTCRASASAAAEPLTRPTAPVPPPISQAAAPSRPRLGAWLVLYGHATADQVVRALVAQERQALLPIEVLAAASVPAQSALEICAAAEDRGMHPFQAAALAGHGAAERLHARQHASRPPLGRVLVEQGVLSAGRMRELLSAYFTGETAAPAPVSTPPAHAIPAIAAARTDAGFFPQPCRITCDQALADEIAAMTDGDARTRFEAGFLALRDGDGLAPLLDRLYRDLHSMKGSFGFIGAGLSQRTIHAMEDALSLCKRRPDAVARIDREALIDALLAGIDLVWRLRDACLSARDESAAGVAAVLPGWKASLDAACSIISSGIAAADAATGHDINSEF